MDRRGFLKSCLGGVAAVVAAPLAVMGKQAQELYGKSQLLGISEQKKAFVDKLVKRQQSLKAARHAVPSWITGCREFTGQINGQSVTCVCSDRVYEELKASLRS